MHSLRARVEERDQVRIGEELATVAFVSGVRACVRVCVRACVRASERACVCVFCKDSLPRSVGGRVSVQERLEMTGSWEGGERVVWGGG